MQTKGKVYAIDFDKKAVELTKKNLQKFGVKAEEVILGKAQTSCQNYWRSML